MYIKLFLGMVGTALAILLVTALGIGFVLYALGVFSFTALLIYTVGISVFQWLFAPAVIELAYSVREADPTRYSWLHEIVEELSRKSGIRKPKVMIADIPVPNAFAYGSPLYGNRVAVTRGLLNVLSRDEIAAVLGHEIGHLKHRDVQIMTFATILPAIFLLLARYLFWWSFWVPAAEEREERGATPLILVAVIVGVIGFLLNLLVLGLSRLREYYADYHSALVVRGGARKLQLALAKIVTSTARIVSHRPELLSHLSPFRALFITDPNRAIEESEALAEYSREWFIVERLKRRRLTFMDQLMELFSTHPHIVKRLRALDEIARELGQ